MAYDSRHPQYVEVYKQSSIGNQTYNDDDDERRTTSEAASHATCVAGWRRLHTASLFGCAYVP